MATRIIGTRTVRRETAGKDPSFGETLMIQLEPSFIRIWQKGRRRRFNVTYTDIFRLGHQVSRPAPANGHVPELYESVSKILDALKFAYNAADLEAWVDWCAWNITKDRIDPVKVAKAFMDKVFMDLSDRECPG